MALLAAASAASSRMRRVLPTPAAPATRTARGVVGAKWSLPVKMAFKECRRSSISRSRPTSGAGDDAGRCGGGLLAKGHCIMLIPALLEAGCYGLWLIGLPTGWEAAGVCGW